MSLCTSVYMCFVVTCWEGLSSWLSFVVSNCEFVTFPLVSWVRCGTGLYRFLIFAPLLTLVGITRKFSNKMDRSHNCKLLNESKFYTTQLLFLNIIVE